MSRVALVLAFVLLPACASPRVTGVALAPRADGPLPVRRAFYESQRPIAFHMQRDTGQVHRDAMPWTDTSVLELENGDHVDDPRALLVNVDAGGPTALAAARHEAALAWRTPLYATGLVAVGVGSVGSLLRLSHSVPELTESNAFLVMMPVVSLVGLGAIFGAVYADHVAARERDTAFLTYDEALRSRLALPSSPADAPTASARLVVVAGACVDEAQLRAAVTSRLHENPFTDTAGDVVRVHAVADDDGTTATIELFRSGQNAGTRRLHAPCSGITEDVALVVATMLTTAEVTR